MSVNYELFKVFDAIARSGNITRAAEELCLSRVTVTQELGSLERQLGLRLFQRHSRGVRLTPEGEALFRQIAPAVEALRAAERQAVAFGRLETGSVRLSYNHAATQQVFQGIIAGFQERFPGVVVQSSLINRASVIDALNAGIVELALVSRPGDPSLRNAQRHVPEIHEDIRAYSLGVYDDIFVVHRHLERLAEHPQRLRALAGYPFIFWRDRNSPTASYYLELLGGGHGRREHDLFPGDTGTIFELLRSGDYIANLCRFTLSAFPGREDYVPLAIEDPLLSTQYLLYDSKSAPLSFAAASLVKYLLQYELFSPEETVCSI